MKRYLLYIALFFPFLCLAQNELRVGTLNLSDYYKPNNMPRLVTTDTIFHSNTLPRDTAVKITLGNSFAGKPIFNVAGLTSLSGTSEPVFWHNGKVVFSGSVTRMPGLMQIDNGAVGITQCFGNFSFYGGGVVNKYGFHRGVFTQYGLEGTVSYQLAKNLSISAFASYYFGGVPLFGSGMPLTPAMIGYFDTSRFGGYADYKINDKFGVQVGGQAVQVFGTKRYQVEPIVTPYFKVGKIEIGLPVGQIVNGLIRDQINKRDFKQPGRRPLPPKR
ncbi:MAG: hypothetical protein K2J74_04280 [Muribaculaceae bacterium]|nr:hypothetical protein [Muribaculaceae bacterium]